MSKNKEIKTIHGSYILLAFAILVGSAMWFYTKMTDVAPQVPQATIQNQITSAKFSCDGGKTIQATFVNGTNSHVELALSNGKNLNLSQTISADGGRYANWDESVVFWNKGNTAFIQEGNANTFNNCIQSSK